MEMHQNIQEIAEKGPGKKAERRIKQVTSKIKIAK